MGSRNAKFLVGFGIGSTIGALVYHFSRTVKAKKSKNGVPNALHEIETDAELTAVEAKKKAVKADAKMAEKVAGKATEVRDRLASNF